MAFAHCFAQRYAPLNMADSESAPAPGGVSAQMRDDVHRLLAKVAAGSARLSAALQQQHLLLEEHRESREAFAAKIAEMHRTIERL